MTGAAPIVKWNWDFGDASSADPQTDEGMIVAHRFDTVGTFTVTLTVVDASGATAKTTTSITTTAYGGTDYYVSSSSGRIVSGSCCTSRLARSSCAALHRPYFLRIAFSRPSAIIARSWALTASRNSSSPLRT